MSCMDIVYKSYVDVPVIFLKKYWIPVNLMGLQSKFSTVIQSKFWFKMCIFAKFIVM